MEKTLEQYDRAIAACREIFRKKTRDYGTAWRILRPASLTDQLFIKAKRIRQIEEQGRQQIDDPVVDEYRGILNYSIMALIQLTQPSEKGIEIDAATVLNWYDEEVEHTRALMIRKNHDYGEAWREMRISSITDLILMKLLRVKQIEDNAGETLISEGLEANYRDIVNYSAFALIRIGEAAKAAENQ